HGTNVRAEEDLLDALRRHSWPGNARELRSEIRRLYFLADGEELDARDLALDPPVAPTAADEDADAREPLVRAVRPMAESEEAAMRLALEESGGHRDVAAQSLGMSRAAFYAKLKRYGIAFRRSRARAGGSSPAFTRASVGAP